MSARTLLRLGSARNAWRVATLIMGSLTRDTVGRIRVRRWSDRWSAYLAPHYRVPLSQTVGISSGPLLASGSSDGMDDCPGRVLSLARSRSVQQSAVLGTRAIARPWSFGAFLVKLCSYTVAHLPSCCQQPVSCPG